MNALRFCLVVLVALGIVAASAAPALPVPSLEAAEAVALQVGPAGQCGGEPVYSLMLSVRGKQYILLTFSQRFLLYDNADGDGTDVWLGVVQAGGTLKVTSYLTFGELGRWYPSPCAALQAGA